MQIQGGVGHTLGEADFGKLLSPAVALSAGRQLTLVWSLRPRASNVDWQINAPAGLMFHFGKK